MVEYPYEITPLQHFEDEERMNILAATINTGRFSVSCSKNVHALLILEMLKRCNFVRIFNHFFVSQRSCLLNWAYAEAVLNCWQSIIFFVHDLGNFYIPDTAAQKKAVFP
ncbi:unnamed protein product [Fraxinus pennsylvanica]|uniref:Uncharacterized protein n=1 Tax=Fraxinus pennsylvanica TaxID=56036 RepID=A0AAD1YZC7_9LAMI|nr:unnamed protein product [Fraxinus pennsylvanica]